MTSSYVRLIAVTTLVALTLAVAPVAHADVLVHAVRKKVCLGKAIKTGVFYQAHSGGPRKFKIRIFNPSGQVVFFTKGKAAEKWHYWKYWPDRKGRYKVVYRGPNWRGAYPFRARTC